MNIIFLLIPTSILIAAAFLAAFIWAVKSGQYEDTDTPAMRVLLEEQSAAGSPRATGPTDDKSERRSLTRPVQDAPPRRVGDRRSMSKSFPNPSDS
jgi:cbb3-type cytochrome oxidase maturation protein